MNYKDSKNSSENPNTILPDNYFLNIDYNNNKNNNDNNNTSSKNNNSIYLDIS